MNNEPIFVFGMARSGTTLLQRVLNSFNNVYICGEHNGAVEPLIHSYNLMKKPQRPHVDKFDNPKFNPCWERLISKDKMREVYTNAIKQLFNPNNENIRWGFKETASRHKNEKFYIDLLNLFPNCKIFFIKRDVEKTKISSLKLASAERKKELKNNIIAYNQWTKEYHEFANSYFKLIDNITNLYPERTILINYEELCKNQIVVCESIANFIGEPLNKRKALLVLSAGVN